MAGRNLEKGISFFSFDVRLLQDPKFRRARQKYGYLAQVVYATVRNGRGTPRFLLYHTEGDSAMEELAKLAKSGDSDALLELWESVRRLCFKLARRYRTLLAWMGWDADDIEQALFLAVYSAVQAFDASSGRSFGTYLTFHVQNALREPLGLRGRSKEIQPAPVSLDEPLDDEDCTRADLVPDPRAETAFESAEACVWRQQLHSALLDALDTLPAEQAQTLRATYFHGCTAQEAARRLNLTTGQVTRAKHAALQKLRTSARLRRFVSEDAYHGTGYRAWKSSGRSVQERVVIRMEELENNTI